MTIKDDVGVTAALAAHPARIHNDYKGERTLSRSFTLTEFADIAEQIGQEEVTEQRQGNSKWYEGTLDDALRMARGEGWKGGTKTIDSINLEVSRLVDAEVVSDTFSYRYDVVGGAIDIGRFLTGEPECMIEAHPVPLAKRGKVVRVVVPFGISSAVKPSEILRRGSAVVSLIDALARAHYSLEVWSVMACHSGSKARTSVTHRFAYAVKVLGAADKYDPALVAYGTGHPTMFRRLAFMVGEHENRTTRHRFGWDNKYYGSPSWEASIADLPEYAQNGPSIVLPFLDMYETAKYATDESIAAWIEEQVTAIKTGEAFQGE